MHSQLADLEQSLFRQLECPVCAEYMVPPITFCVNGHNICNICRPRITVCPTCRQQLLGTRNLALETLASDVKYPCTYQKYGCGEIFAHDVIRQHQDNCRYRRQTCPVARMPNERCSWTGIYNDIKEHLKEKHLAHCYDYVDGKMRALKNIAPSMSISEFVFAKNEVFYFRLQASDNTLYVVLQYIGPPENAAKYKYKVKFVTKDNTKDVTIMHVVRSFAEKLDDVFGAGNCGKLHYDVVSRLRDENGRVMFKTEILRVTD